jgi:hypothetical protein
MRTFLLPRKDYKIDDTWHVAGLKGTGSKDVVVDDVFVPEHRTHRLIDGFKRSSPGNEINKAPLFRLPDQQRPGPDRAGHRRPRRNPQHHRAALRPRR